MVSATKKQFRVGRTNWKVILLASSATWSCLHPNGGKLDLVLERATTNVEKFNLAHTSLSWRAMSTLRELEPTNLARTRRILEGTRYTRHWNQPEKISNEILEMRENGRAMTAKEIQAEVRRQGGGAGFRFLNPFSAEARPHYRYEWQGTAEDGGRRLVKIGFRTDRKESGYFQGHAWVQEIGGQVRELDLKPTKYPLFVSSFHLRMKFGDVREGNEVWSVPERAEVDLRVTAKFIITFADIPMTISETYGNYIFFHGS